MGMHIFSGPHVLDPYQLPALYRLVNGLGISPVSFFDYPERVPVGEVSFGCDNLLSTARAVVHIHAMQEET